MKPYKRVATHIANMTLILTLCIGAASLLLSACNNVLGPQVQATSTAISTATQASKQEDATPDICITLAFVYRTMLPSDTHFRPYLNAEYCVKNGKFISHFLDQRTGDHVTINTQVESNGLVTAQVSYTTGNLVYASSSYTGYAGHVASVATNQWHSGELHEYDVAIAIS